MNSFVYFVPARRSLFNQLYLCVNRDSFWFQWNEIDSGRDSYSSRETGLANLNNSLVCLPRACPCEKKNS